MGRPKGLAKTGGRKLGTPNKNSQALSERLESLGCDPIEASPRSPSTLQQSQSLKCVASRSWHSTSIQSGRLLI